jgi:hypothetical protein
MTCRGCQWRRIDSRNGAEVETTACTSSCRETASQTVDAGMPVELI